MATYQKSDRIYWLSQALIKAVYDTLFSGEISGKANPLPNGPCIIAVNHASHFDPPLIGGNLPRQLTYLARKTLWAPGAGSWWLDSVGSIPVDRDGESDRHRHPEQRDQPGPGGEGSTDPDQDAR